MSAVPPEFGTRKARALAGFRGSPAAEEVSGKRCLVLRAPYPCRSRHSGVSLTTTWCPGARRRKPSSTTTGATTTTCPCGTAPTPTCWSTSASPSSVSARAPALTGPLPSRPRLSCGRPSRLRLAPPPSRHALGAAGVPVGLHVDRGGRAALP